MIDISILRLMKTREVFDRMYKNIPLKALEARTQVILKDISTYYHEFSTADNIDYIEFKDMFFSHWHRGMEKDQLEYYNKILDMADKETDQVSQKVITNALVELNLAETVMQIIQHYNEGVDMQIIDEVEKALTSAQGARDRKQAATFIEVNLDTLMEENDPNFGFKYRNEELAACLNPAKPGDDFTIVAARPNQGKTTFLLNETSNWMSQMGDRPGLWLNNEGRGERIVKRNIQVALGLPMSELYKLQEQGTLMNAYEEAMGASADSFKVKNIHDWHSWEVEELIDNVRPKFVVFDMIDHITFSGMGDARTDQILEEMYKWARTLGVKYDLVPLATSQVSVEGEGLAYPDKSMLKDSKTGKQGAADNIIMVGHTNDPLLAKSRYISVPKTKSNKEGSQPARREFIFDIFTGRFSPGS